jgi:hypothetical protein
MTKLRVARTVLERTRSRANLTDQDREAVDQLLAQGEGKGPVSAEVSEYPTAFLEALLDDDDLTPNQRAVVVLRLHGMAEGKVDRDAIWDTPVRNPGEFAGLFSSLGTRGPNCEWFFNGRWYPITLNIQVWKSQDDQRRQKIAYLYACMSLCDLSHGIAYYVTPSLFTDDAGRRVERTFREIMNRLGLRPVQTPASEYNLKLVRAEHVGHEPGKLVLVSGSVVVHTAFAWWTNLESRTLATPGRPRKCVVEPELEVPQDQRNYRAPWSQNGKAVTRLPFVRLFSLDTKTYVYADVDDVASYQFDESAMEKLHLPPAMLQVLTHVFHTPTDSLFGDVIAGKHGGVVILACGNPGVGKTLTAEVYAEHTKRPLYVLELGELGTNVASVEEKLQRVFTRVGRWNAVLQFDECEIFLAQRGSDLERSAIVGIFLRLLDYYQGILFLTTNRWDVLDHAVLSRVMLKLDYPDLDATARAAVWRTMLTAAGLELTDGTLEELAQTEINGRQIRNLVRLTKILYPAGRVALPQLREVLAFGCKS